MQMNTNIDPLIAGILNSVAPPKVSDSAILALVRHEAGKFGRCCDQYQDSDGTFCCHECGQRTMAMLKNVQMLLGIRKDGERVNCEEETAAARKAAILSNAAPEIADKLKQATTRPSDIAGYLDKTAPRLANMHLILSRELGDEAAVIRGAVRDHSALLAKLDGAA